MNSEQVEFEKWLMSYPPASMLDTNKYVFAREVKNECIRQCLEILKKNKTTYRVEDGDIGSKLLFDYINIKVIEEIEKL